MGAVDFAEWAVPDLVLTLGERTYSVRPPSVSDARKLLASAVRGEVNLGFLPGVKEVPPEIQEVLDTIEPDDHPALGPVYQQLIDDGVDMATVNRMAYYAVFYWAKGKEYADWLATLLWQPVDEDSAAAGDAPRKV